MQLRGSKSECEAWLVGVKGELPMRPQKAERKAAKLCCADGGVTLYGETLTFPHSPLTCVEVLLSPALKLSLKSRIFSWLGRQAPPLHLALSKTSSGCPKFLFVTTRERWEEPSAH